MECKNCKRLKEYYEKKLLKAGMKICKRCGELCWGKVCRTCSKRGRKSSPSRRKAAQRYYKKNKC